MTTSNQCIERLVCETLLSDGLCPYAVSACHAQQGALGCLLARFYSLLSVRLWLSLPRHPVFDSD